MAISATQIGINLGKNIFKGKNIRIDDDGFENFDDYFTETDTDESDIEIEDCTDDVKLIALQPPAEDGAVKSSVSPLSLSNFPSRKRLSFPVESMSDSSADASEEVSYVKSVISKRGMKSLGHASTADSKDSDHQEPTVSKKEVTTTKTSKEPSAASASDSNGKVRILSKRGMKSFPEDEESIVKKVSSSLGLPSTSVKKCLPENDVCEPEPKMATDDGGSTSPSSSEESQEKDVLENDNGNNEDVLSEDTSAGKRKRMTPESDCPRKNTNSPKKVISAFGIHKPTVQTHYFDILETNLSLIEEVEKSYRKSTKTLKKPAGTRRSAENYKGSPPDVPKYKYSPLRHKKPQPSPTAKHTLKSKSVASDVPQDKSSPLRHKKPQPSSPAKHTLKSKSAPEDKSPPLRPKRPQLSPAAKQLFKTKSSPPVVPEDKSSPSRHKKPQPLPTAKQSLKRKSSPPGVPKDKPSPLRHKKPQPAVTVTYRLKRKSSPPGVPKDKSSPLRPKKPQPSPTAKHTLKSKSAPPDKSSPLRHKKPQPSPTAKHTLKSKSSPQDVPEVKSSPLRRKKSQSLPTDKQSLESENHINGGVSSPRKTSTKSPVATEIPDDKTYLSTSSSFAPKHTYRFINNKMLDSSNEHDIIYCCCLDSEKAFMGMISLKKGAYKQLNRSNNQVMFLVQYGKVKVRIGYEHMILTTGDSFMVPANEIYSLRNKSVNDCGLIVTILK